MTKKVLVVGGTHGNEWTGIQIVEKYAESLKKEFPELELEFILGNPEAYKINKRFKDEDLNRAFQYLNENRVNSFEHQRAKEIQLMINQTECFVIDLHTTTSNMGRTVIISHYNEKNFAVASRISHIFDDVRVIGSPDPEKKYLASQSDYGLMIEVGPIANGLIHGEILENTVSLLREILSSLCLNSDKLPSQIELYEEIENYYYPQNELGDVTGFIHPQLQNKDFIAVEGKFKAFKTFVGEEILININEKLYPIFINEAAYYPQKLAFTLCRKCQKHF